MQRWFRKRLLAHNVMDLVERNKVAPTIQKFLRGYLVRESMAVEIHRYRMRSHLEAFELKFTPIRDYIIESLQIRLAYIFRKRIADRKERERLEEIRRKQEAILAKKQAAREHRIR